MFSLTNLTAFCKYKKQQNVTSLPLFLPLSQKEQKQKKTVLQVTLFWKVPQNSSLRLSRLSIKGASTKGLVFASKDGSWFTTLCQTSWDNFQSVQMFLSGSFANNLGLSPSTVHNIVKGFRESGEILVPKGQRRKPLLNVRDHRALRRYCLRNRHATMMDVATWVREWLGKSLSLKTVCRCIKKCNLKLFYAKMKASINFAQKQRQVLWVRSYLRWTGKQWKLWSDESTSQLVFGKNGHQILRAKGEKDHPDCSQRKVQKPASVMVWGCISAHDMGDLHICEGTIYADAYVGNFGETYAAKMTTFPRNSMSISAGQCQASFCMSYNSVGFIGKECVSLTGLPAVQICLLLKMYGASWRGETDGNHGLLSSSCPVYTKNGQKFHLQNYNNLNLQCPNNYKV